MPSPRRRTRLSATRVRELLDYDPAAGTLTWRVDRSRTAKAGDDAGFVRKTDGFITVTIDHKPWMAHRLIWLHVHGALPTHRLRFKDRDPGNLRLDNIEEETAVHSQTKAAVYQRERRVRMRREQ